MTRPLNFGILGCARIVRRAIAGALAATPSAQLAAIASRDRQTARAWADEYRIPTVHESYEALIADPAIDAVYIPLPNELHKPWVLAAAQAGKHVLCEKPLALDAAEAQQMVDGCRKHGVILHEAFMWRHQSRVAHAAQDAGRRPTGRAAAGENGFFIRHRSQRLAARPETWGGALYDLGCYGINAARLFTGAEPIEVRAAGHRYESGVDMTLSMLLRFPQDVVALLDCSFECPSRNRIEIVGTEGALEFPDGVLPRPESELIFRHGDSTDTIRFPASDQYVGQIECFCASVAAGRLLDPAEDGLANMKVLDAVGRVMEPN